MRTKTGRQKIQNEKEQYIKDAADIMAKMSNDGEAGSSYKEAASIYEQELSL
jgi:hypothetical protein